MKLSTLKKKMSEHLYMEDGAVIDIVMASILSNILELGQPVWIVLIGAPSSGKTQYIIPLDHAQPPGEKTIHQVTDLTPNTFLSGFKSKEDGDVSLLKRIGEKGTIIFPDLTSLFSKEAQVMHEILGQLRHVYDGYLTKHMGNQKPLEWKGSLGIIAASTGSIYRHFDSIADMGERFMYYRIKPYNRDKAIDKALSRSLYGKELDQYIGELYSDYIKSVIGSFAGSKKLVFTDSDNQRIKEMAKFASLIRTSVHVNQYTREVDAIPDPEMPMRTALQLRGLAIGMMAMNIHEHGKPDLTEENFKALEWSAYSLANDERRQAMQALVRHPQGVTTAGIATTLNLPTNSVLTHLQQLNVLGICRRVKNGSGNADVWVMDDQNLVDIIMRLADIEQEEGVFSGEGDDVDILDEDVPDFN